MIKSFTLIAASFMFCMQLTTTFAKNNLPAGCSVPGTATATEDSICTGGISVLQLAGYNGAIQWQSYNGSAWVNEAGAGSTTDLYSVTPPSTTDYRAMVTATGCPPDSSNVVTITVGIPAPSTTGATRCGYGPVTLTATGSGTGTIKWYDMNTGGALLSTGSSYSPNVAATTTFWAADVSNGGGAGVAPMDPQNSIYTGNVRGYWFTSPLNFTITGLYVMVPGSTQNIAVVRFNPAVPPPLYATLTNAFTTLFLTQNNPSTTVIPVNIPVYAGDVIGILGQADNQNSYSTNPQTTTINGQSVTLTRMGMQFPLSTTAPQDLWQEAGGSISRVEITYEVGCESPRTASVATVTSAPVVTINATATALCAGQSATLTATSSNGGYSYTWSPPAGLNTIVGATVIATPATPTTYTVVANDGTCGYIDSVYINVGPVSSAGIATATGDTICAGTPSTLILTNSIGSVQWQSYNGSVWVNETGTGNNTPLYTVMPAAAIDYRAVVTSGGCAPDTSIVLHIEVVTITDPVTVNDTICGPGIANLSASGAGVLTWYSALTGGTTVNTGSTFATNISATTTYYVEASAGGTLNVGPANSGMGNQVVSASFDYGLGFDVTQQVILDKVYVYPAQTGTITVNLRATQGGTILNTVTQNVTAFVPLTPVNLGFVVNPGTGYRLELAAGSAQLYNNSNGAVYPYTTAACPLSITGYLNPNFTTGIIYYYFYNWQVTEGCKSNRIPVTGVVLTLPPVPTITPNGNQLTSSSPTNNQWYVNGSIISGATAQVYTAPWAGSYTVVVTDPITGCTSTSAPFVILGINGLNGASSLVYLFPNPVKNMLSVKSEELQIQKIEILSLPGQQVYTAKMNPSTEFEIDMTSIASGFYIIKVHTEKGILQTKICKE